MKYIKPSSNEHQWPRHIVSSIECRKRDLVIRIADWTKDKDSPNFDVEVYIGGVYDWNESESFPEKQDAVNFAQQQIKKLL